MANPIPWAPRLRSFPLGREAVRAILAFLVYLALYALWALTPLQRVYLDLLTRTAGAAVRALAHFPPVPGLPPPRLEAFHTPAVFLIAVFAVATRVPFRRRLRLFGVLLAGVLALDFVAAMASLQLQAARAAFNGPGILLLLPGEFNGVEYLWYVFYTIPLQGGPFALLILSALLNGGVLAPAGPDPAAAVPSVPERGSARERTGFPRMLRPILIGSAVLGVAALATGAVWLRRRESIPLHAGAHVRLGELFRERGELGAARGQFEAAAFGGGDTGRAWFRLAQLVYQAGDRAEAARILRRAAQEVRDPEWAERIRAARDAFDEEESRPWEPIVAVPPSASP